MRKISAGEEIIILRVISGEAGGLQLKTVKGTSTRPTSDKVKGALFNIIAGYLGGSEVLDIFAGTGSLGIEALSRGAEHAVFFDKSPESCSVIRDNLAHTKLAGRAEVYQTDFASGIERLFRDRRKFDIILLDPPYNKKFIQESLKLLTKNDIMKDEGMVVAEHSISDALPEAFEGLKAVDTRKYGDTMLTIYIQDGNRNK
ncbi:MAG TPA: 16S rRNA (guanine(966)-N(2))-methyltransferase RsmD [Clostridia bacterium]|nr:16S rRNA (guanine(966)-N(2))-methyltransferase RsmD [Clostridia bacterium]